MDTLDEVTDKHVNEVEQTEEPNNESENVERDNIAEKTNDELADAVAQNEVDDDARKLFVGGLNWETTEADLSKYFSEWGNVTRCIIKVDRFTGNSRGFGFVTFEDEDSVNKVLAVPEHKLMGKRIDPKRAKPSREAMKKIFVGGIDPDLSEECIKEYFSQFGQVESLDLPYDTQKKKRKHYIFVSFSTEAAARKAIARERQEIHGRPCDVRVAVTKDQANKNKSMKMHGYIDPSYAAYAPYAYGDYSGAFANIDPYTYGGYYSCYDYFNAAAVAANSSTAAGGYGVYTNYATNPALFRSQYAVAANARVNNSNTNNNNAGGTNSNNQNSVAGGYPMGNSSHWNPAAAGGGSNVVVDSAAGAAPANYSDYAAAAAQPQ